MTSTAFSSSSEEVLSRTATVEREANTKRHDLWSYYELERCVEFVARYSKVALQFPDHLLVDSVAVAAILERESGKAVYILGDTSYGSCCVDEVAAEHMAAECIIHFGPSCLTQTRRIPVLYIFGHEEVDVADCSEKFLALFPEHSQPVLLLYDTVYSHCTESFMKLISHQGYLNLVLSELLLPNPTNQPRCCQDTRNGSMCCARGSLSCEGVERLTEKVNNLSSEERKSCAVSRGGDGDLKVLESIPDKNNHKEGAILTEGNSSRTIVRCGRKFALTRPLAEYTVFYIGHESACLTNLLLNISECEFFSYSPATQETKKESVVTNKMLGRRYFLVQKAKEAKAVGILVGTLGAADYLPMINRLKKVLQRAGKKYYTMAVGKLNPAKLANFMEVDIYVLVACPECSLHNFKEFFQPVVTPYEMEVACLSCREWSGRPVTDYQQLLPGGNSHVCVESGAKEEEEAQYSFISGGLIQTQPTDQEMIVAGEGAVVPRQEMPVAIPHSAVYLHSRSWHGLEQKLGETPVSSVVEGRRGVAASYTHETYS